MILFNLGKNLSITETWILLWERPARKWTWRMSKVSYLCGRIFLPLASIQHSLDITDCPLSSGNLKLAMAGQGCHICEIVFILSLRIYTQVHPIVRDNCSAPWSDVGGSNRFWKNQMLWSVTRSQYVIERRNVAGGYGVWNDTHLRPEPQVYYHGSTLRRVRPSHARMVCCWFGRIFVNFL